MRQQQKRSARLRLLGLINMSRPNKNYNPNKQAAQATIENLLRQIGILEAEVARWERDEIKRASCCETNESNLKIAVRALQCIHNDCAQHHNEVAKKALEMIRSEE